MRSLTILFIWMILPASGMTQQSNQIQEGFDAYNRSDFQTAYKLWLPVAEKGDKIAQYNIGILYLNGQGIEQNSSKAEDWFGRSANQQYELAMLQMGILNLQNHKFSESLRWLDKVLLYVGNEPSKVQIEAEDLIRDLYKKANLFPSPLPGWSTEELTIYRKRKVASMLAIFYRTTIERNYSSNSSDQKVQIRIELNYFQVGILIDAINGAKETGMKEMREGALKNGIKPFSLKQYIGCSYYDEQTGSIEKTLKLWQTKEMGQNIIISVMSNMNNIFFEQFLNELDLERVAEILEGHAYEAISWF